MRSKLFIILFVSISLTIPCTSHAQDPITLIIGMTKRVIKAIDLQVQRIQNKTIALQNAQQAVENALHKLKLDEITQWATKQKELYQTFYDELWKVKSAIAYYKRVKEIVQKQVQLVGEYKRAYALFKQDSHFTPDELDYMGKVYNGILTESIKNLDQLQLVLSAFAVQMDDAKRLEILESAANKIEENATDLKRFNNSNVILSLQRAKDEMELYHVETLYGLK